MVQAFVSNYDRTSWILVLGGHGIHCKPMGQCGVRHSFVFVFSLPSGSLQTKFAEIFLTINVAVVAAVRKDSFLWSSKFTLTSEPCQTPTKDPSGRQKCECMNVSCKPEAEMSSV